jgi:hypothetical protein
MAAALSDTARIPPRISFRRVRDEMALLNLDTGVYFGLDEVGARMWELVAEHGCLQLVAEQMEKEYDVDPVRLRQDLLRLVDELMAKRLLEIV